MRFGGPFISGGDLISFVREADIELLQLFGKILECSEGTNKGQKFDVTHQTCRLITLDDISVIRPKNFLPTAQNMRGGGTMCPTPVLIVDPIPHGL